MIEIYNRMLKETDVAKARALMLGRADGAPTQHAMGASAAAPVLFRIFDLLPELEHDVATSASFRDAWAVGFDALHTVGVWLGRADGPPTQHAMGASAAAPVLFRIFDLLPEPETWPTTGQPTAFSRGARRFPTDCARSIINP